MGLHIGTVVTVIHVWVSLSQVQLYYKKIVSDSGIYQRKDSSMNISVVNDRGKQNGTIHRPCFTLRLHYHDIKHNNNNNNNTINNDKDTMILIILHTHFIKYIQFTCTTISVHSQAHQEWDRCIQKPMLGRGEYGNENMRPHVWKEKGSNAFSTHH